MNNFQYQAGQDGNVERVSLSGRNGVDYFLYSLLCIATLLSFYWTVREQTWANLFWDLNPIINAVNGQKDGIDPYRHVAQSMFIYHPYVLKVLIGINNLLPLRGVFISLYILTLGWFVIQLCAFLNKKYVQYAILLGLAISLGFGGVGLLALLCGNFSAYFHLVLFTLILQFLRVKRTWLLVLFSLALLSFTLVKPYFLSYALFYFLTFKFWKALGVSLTVGLGVAALWFAAKYTNAIEYASFLSALQYQLITKDDLGGFSTVRLSAPYIGYVAGFLLHLAVVGSLLLCCFYHPRIKRYFTDVESSVMLLIFFIVSLNPRLVFYDFIICLVSLFILVLIKFPKHYQRIIVIGLPFAGYAQIATHSIRWVLLSFICVIGAFIAALYLFRDEPLEPKFEANAKN
jgi:hypothetical protein